MAQLPHTFPFPSRAWMLVNLFLYIPCAVLIPMQVGSELLYQSLTSFSGIALWVAAVVNGVLALAWMRYFDKLQKQLAQPG
jgi:hypothetical protein